MKDATELRILFVWSLVWIVPGLTMLFTADGIRWQLLGIGFALYGKVTYDIDLSVYDARRRFDLIERKMEHTTRDAL